VLKIDDCAEIANRVENPQTLTLTTIIDDFVNVAKRDVILIDIALSLSNLIDMASYNAYLGTYTTTTTTTTSTTITTTTNTTNTTATTTITTSYN